MYQVQLRIKRKTYLFEAFYQNAGYEF